MKMSMSSGIGFKKRSTRHVLFQINIDGESKGVLRESNSRPLAPEARIIPLDQTPLTAPTLKTLNKLT